MIALGQPKGRVRDCNGAMVAMRQEDIAGLILAGGTGRRMGGADKAMLRLGDRPLFVHLLERLAPQVGQIAISANGDATRFPSLTVLPDPLGWRGEGPLAGLLAGLNWAETIGAAALVSVAVDTPFIPRDLVRRLCGDGTAFARSAGRDHPAAAFWPTRERTRIAVMFETGERRLRKAASAARTVVFEETPDPFFNINRPEALQIAQARLSGAA